MSEWKEVKIGDVCSVKRGASPRPIQNFMCKNGMPWVKIADATRSNSRYIYSTEEYITEAGVPKSRTVTPGTLIVSNSATPGLPKIMGITGCVHDGWLIINDFNGVLKEYMYYKFIDIRRVLSNQANGSVFMNLKTDIVKDFPIKVPSIQEQEVIVAFLNNIDAKIECNQKICENLEAQAQALFKHWFIDFAPFKNGKFVESELGMIPEGWRVGTLEELVDIKYGKDHKKLNEGNIPAYGSAGLMRTVDEKLYDGESVLIPRKGTLNNIMYVNEAFWTVDTMFYTIPKKSNILKYLYMKLKRIDFNKMNVGTSIPSNSTSQLNKLKIVIPTDEILGRFDGIMSSLLQELMHSQKESKGLATLRDTLLPKLMSGQIKV